MQECTHCSSKFKRSDIIKSVWLKAYVPIKCPNCGVEYVVDFWPRIKLSLLNVLPVFPLMIIFNEFLDVHYLGALIPYAIWLALIIYFTPNIVTYHEKKEVKKQSD